MPTARHALLHLSALALALGVAACGEEQAPKPAAKPEATAPATPPTPAAQTAAPIKPAPAAPPAPAASATDPDTALAKQVKKALEKTQGVTGQQIDVTAKGGAVTLWGTVADPKEQALAVEAAKAVPGVKAVENKLAIVKGS